MMGVKPNKVLWSRVNQVILGESTAEVMITFISAMCQMLIAAGAVRDEEQARVHLAAMLLSPDTGPVGSLVPRLKAELRKLNV